MVERRLLSDFEEIFPLKNEQREVFSCLFYKMDCSSASTRLPVKRAVLSLPARNCCLPEGLLCTVHFNPSTFDINNPSF
jgi:hypothetical protein